MNISKPRQSRSQQRARRLNKFRRKMALRFLERYPTFCTALLSRSSLSPRLKSLSDVPEKAALPAGQASAGFESCMWLFACHQGTRGITRLDLDEAAYLFEVVRSFAAPQMVEIGRLYGGSTILMALAGDAGARLISIDIMPKDDALLQGVLEKIGVASKVTLLAQDANTVDAPDNAYDVVFIDGDHYYENVRKDYDHWKKSVKPGGILLFHDAGTGRDLATWRDGPRRVAREVQEQDARFWKRRPDVASIASFERTQEEWS